MRPLKPPDQQEQIRDILRKYHIERLYHFTDASNWRWIQSRGGLFSLAECKRRGFSIPRPGGDRRSARRDEMLSHDEYVHLCFHWDQPMKLRKQRRGELGPCIVIAVKLEVMWWRDTKFSDVNALTGVAQVGDDAATLRKIDLPTAMRGLWGNRQWQSETTKKQVQAEVLVLGHIPRELISEWCSEKAG